MQKIYVLLRGDQQTGPYTLQEVLQFDLKPYDLIWIEGKSAGWYYPQEIAALQPYLSFLRREPQVSKPTSAKAVHVAMPSLPKTEEPTSEPLFDVEALTPKQVEKPLSNFDENFYARFTKAPENIESTYAGLTASAKQKKQSSVSIGGAITAVVIIGGVFAASWIMSSGAPKTDNVWQEASTAAQLQNEIPLTPEEDKNAAYSKPSSATNKQPKESISKKQLTAFSNKNKQGKKEQVPGVDNTANNASETITATLPTNEEPTIIEDDTNSQDESSASPEKKKKLRDKILDLFKKKPEEKTSGETKNAEEENGERKPVYREGSANLAQMVSIRFTVPNNWMMGIKGAKATLVNRSNVTIAKATVEVLYYDDENELLQKKVITFSRIDAKETQTISIPDHPTATKVEYSILSAEGKPSA